MSLLSHQPTRILYSMLRVKNLEKSIAFYRGILGMTLQRTDDYPEGEFTLAFLGYGDESNHSMIELTYNYGENDYYKGNGFGHIALASVDVYATCDELAEQGVNILRPAGPMNAGGTEVIAFIEDPDGYKIELIQQ